MPKRPNLIRRAALLGLALSAAPALAEDWRLAITPPEMEPFGRSMAFVDVDTIRREGDEIRFDYEIRFQQSGDIWGLRVTAHASCTGHWYEIPAVGVYRGETRVSDGDPQSRQDSAEGSNIYRVIDAACTGRFLSGTVDPVPHTRAFVARQ